MMMYPETSCDSRSWAVTSLDNRHCASAWSGTAYADPSGAVMTSASSFASGLPAGSAGSDIVTLPSNQHISECLRGPHDAPSRRVGGEDARSFPPSPGTWPQGGGGLSPIGSDGAPPCGPCQGKAPAEGIWRAPDGRPRLRL